MTRVYCILTYSYDTCIPNVFLSHVHTQRIFMTRAYPTYFHDTCIRNIFLWHVHTQYILMTRAYPIYSYDTCIPNIFLWHVHTEHILLTRAYSTYSYDTCIPNIFLWHVNTKRCRKHFESGACISTFFLFFCQFQKVGGVTKSRPIDPFLMWYIYFWM